MRGMIFAMSPERVIGLDGKIPWRHPGDLRRFKQVTLGSTIIMGRATFDDNGRPLPGRRNIVVTSRPLDVPGVEVAPSVDEALRDGRRGRRLVHRRRAHLPGGHAVTSTSST